MDTWMKKNKLIFCGLLGIFFLSVFLRVYKFDDWMLFKGDSFRDAILISYAHEDGLKDLPLLGPKAGGTMLRTGPVFYYLEYLATLIFQSTEAPVFAYPVLFFSLLTIPLAFFFLRKFFSLNWSLLLTGLFSVSFVLVEYSRFAWNPNPAPFFNLLFFYALLEIFDEKNLEKKMRWWITAAVAFSVATQLHFSSFMALPIIVVIFSGFHFQKIKNIFNWKRLLVFLGIVILFYFPVILNDLLSQGANTKQFFNSIGSKPAQISLAAKGFLEIKYFAANFLRLLTGYFGNNKYLIFSFAFFVLGAAFLNGYLFKREKTPERKRFLFLTLAILAVFLLLYFPLAKSIEKPRFFLPIAILPFVFWGYLATTFWEKGRSMGKLVAMAGFLIFYSSNLFFNFSWLKELGEAEEKTVPVAETIVLKEKGAPMWWTWSKFKKTAAYMQNDCQEKSLYYMLQKETTEFKNSFEYAMRGQKENRPIHNMNNSVPYNSGGCYYYIAITQSPLPEKLHAFQFDSEKVFGNLTIHRFYFREIPTDGKDEAKDDENFVLEENAEEIDEGGSQETRLSARILSNKKRLFWGDVPSLIKEIRQK
jgi:hypothetical protein